MNKGIICSLTNEIADFEESCPDYEKDETIPPQEAAYDEGPRDTQEVVSRLSDDVISELRGHQDIFYALVGGLFLSIIAAIGWAIVTVATEYQIGFMAIGVGLLIGFGVRFLGQGVDQIYGIIGGCFALLGCLLGNLFSQVGFIAQDQSLGYWDTLLFFDFQTIVLIFQETFSAMDLIFYAIAVGEGYKFAFRQLPLNVEQVPDLTPENNKLRLPLVIASFVILSISFFLLSRGVTGENTFYYESGAIMSTGSFKNGQLDGEWVYYSENGNIQSKAFYREGIEEGDWVWYDESGVVTKRGSYYAGLASGVWISYYPGGPVRDSSTHEGGRLHGPYVMYSEGGDVLQEGSYERDHPAGEWKIYTEEGTISSTGSFEGGDPAGVWKYFYPDGSPSQELNYLGEDKMLIENAWDTRGNQTVQDGNGTFSSYYEKGSQELVGSVANGLKVGDWKHYYENGNLKEVGEFDEEKYYLKEAWDNEGNMMVEDGNGMYESYDTEGMIVEEGKIENGEKTGNWVTYYPGTKVILLDQEFKGGLRDGLQISFYENGTIQSQGNATGEKKTGEWKWFYESGQPHTTVQYLDDRKQGDQLFYTETMGFEAKLETYENGKLVKEELLLKSD